MVLLESLKIEMGESAKSFSLKGSDDKVYTLDDFKAARVLVIVFMCNHCPYVQAVWSRLVDLQERFKNKGVQFVGINANGANPDFSEDSFENMRKYYEKYNMNFPYLIDETQNVAREYKAQCTPDIFVYDNERKLAYHGRIDDNWKDQSKVSKQELAIVIDALLGGGKSSDEQYPTMGCSIKWK